MDDILASVICIFLSSFFFIAALWCHTIRRELKHHDFGRDAVVVPTKWHLLVLSVVASIITSILIISGFFALHKTETSPFILLGVLLVAYSTNIYIFFHSRNRLSDWKDTERRKTNLAYFLLNYGRFFLGEKL